MDGDSIQFDLLKGLQPGRISEAYDRSFRALAVIFEGWAHFRGQRERDYEEPEPGALLAIPFDKFGMLSFRILKAVFMKNKAEVVDAIRLGKVDSSEELFAFNPPFGEIVGKHGRGSGLYNDASPPTYLLDIVHRLQKTAGLSYFDFRLSTRPNGEEYPPSHYATIIKPAMPIDDPRTFLKGFKNREREVVLSLRTGICRLCGYEIRTLGTHYDQAATISDIKWELKKWLPICRSVIGKLRNPNEALDWSNDFSIYSNEAFRKSVENRAPYESARSNILRELPDVLVGSIVDDIQQTGASIWEGDIMTRLSRTSKIAFAISEYIECIRYFREAPEQRITQSTDRAKSMRHRWDKAIQLLPMELSRELIRDIPSVFVKETITTQEKMLNSLIVILERIADEVRQLIKGDSNA